jgi:epoxyqueuosine reductase
MYNNAAKYSQMIKDEALRLGFMQCGIARAGFLEEEAPRLENWLKDQHHGQMAYMENHFDKRLDPRLLVDDARSVISLTLNYFPSEKQADPHAPKISKYAYGADYHTVIKEKLFLLLNFINENIGAVSGRAFVDSAPVLDRAWAKRAGIGWVGKNSNIIGTCTKCIDACPTDAILSPFVIDANKCISYLTIELKEEIPKSFDKQMDNWMFGCDICQDVCPWNRFSAPHKEPAFQPNENLLQMKREDWMDITEDVFKQIFKNSAVKRTKFKGLTRNIDFIRQIPGDGDSI